MKSRLVRKMFTSRRRPYLGLLLVSAMLFYLLARKTVVSCLEQRLHGSLSPSDSEFIAYINKRFIVSPSQEPYSFSHNSRNSNALEFGTFSFQYLSKILRELYPPSGGLEMGFFIEAGALDGEFGSNTLYLEMELKWTGLLVEPDKVAFSKLLGKHRKAWSSNCCLSPKPFPFKTQLMKEAVDGRDEVPKIFYDSHSSIVDSLSYRARTGYYNYYFSVQCLPIESLLRALHVTKVDLFSLDVEDTEVDILKNFPWDTVSVDVWLIEHRHKNSHPYHNRDQVDAEFVKWFNRKGYRLYSVSEHNPKDYVFIKRNSAIDKNYSTNKSTTL